MPPFYTYISSGAPSFTGLLDTYSGASAAYSFRRLSSAYTGNLITVRRDSDNTSIDVGYDPATNYLDTAAITTFCSGTDGYVSVWYDQSGNNLNIFNSGANGQPKIYDSLTGINLVNGKVAIYQSAITQLNFYITGSGLKINLNSVISVAKVRSFVPVNYLLYDYENPQGYFLGGTGAREGYGFYELALYNSNLYENTNQNLGFFDYNGTNYIVDVNQQGVYNFPSTSLITATSMGRSGSSLSTNADIQEIIIYPTSQAINKLGIEANINSFYTIF